MQSPPNYGGWEDEGMPEMIPVQPRNANQQPYPDQNTDAQSLPPMAPGFQQPAGAPRQIPDEQPVYGAMPQQMPYGQYNNYNNAPQQPAGAQPGFDAQPGFAEQRQTPGARPIYGQERPEPEFTGAGTRMPEPPQSVQPDKPQRSKPMYVLIAALVAVLGVCVYLLMNRFSGSGIAYAYVSAGSLTHQYTGDAVIVRNETVYNQDSVSRIDYKVAEGAEVSRGQSIATVYSSGFSSKEWTTLANYRNQIKTYLKTLIEATTGDSRLMTLMNGVKERALELQSIVQGGYGSLTVQEEMFADSLAERLVYLKSKFADDQKLSRYYDDENAQVNRISSWTKQYAAGVDGHVSFYMDGFESAVTMANYLTFSPAAVRKMYNGAIPETGLTSSRNSTSVYRIVREEPWAVLMLVDKNQMDSWSPITGSVYGIRIEAQENAIVYGTIDSWTKSGGELLIRFSVSDTSVLENIMYLRSCRVTVGDNVQRLVVPTGAIFTQEGRKGVVIHNDDGTEFWMGVEILSEDGEYTYIIPDYSSVLTEGTRVRLFQ